MDPHTKKFIQHLRSVTLSPEERAALRASLLSKMHTGSARAPEPTISVWAWFIQTRRVQVALLLLVIVAGYGSTVTLAAENALPGEALYAVKTQINERVARLVTGKSQISVTNFETRLLERRLEEAEALDKDTKLETPLKEAVREAVRKQSVRAETGAEARDDDHEPQGRGNSVEKVLEKHSQILEKLELTKGRGPM